MTMNLKHSFIIVNTFKRLDGNIEKTVYDYGNVFLRVRLQFPFILSGGFLQIWLLLRRMKEYYAVDGSMSGLFLEVESDIVSCSNNRPEEIIKEIFTPSWDYRVQRSRLRSASSGRTSCRPRENRHLDFTWFTVSGNWYGQNLCVGDILILTHCVILFIFIL